MSQLVNLNLVSKYSGGNFIFFEFNDASTFSMHLLFPEALQPKHKYSSPRWDTGTITSAHPTYGSTVVLQDGI